MGKTAFLTPLYISVAWTLMISYQLFTQTALSTIIMHINIFEPTFGSWLTNRMDMLVFIYSFAWIFVLSSVLPSTILGKEKGVLIQFFVCLTLAFLAFVVQDVLVTFGGEPVDQLFNLAILLYNPFLAVGYLLIPYLTMLMLDLRAKKAHKKKVTVKKAATSDIYYKH